MPERAIAHRDAQARIGISSIPVEILSAIFEAAASTINDHRIINTQLLPALLRTSRFFHAVARCTPFLWSFITFECRMPSLSPEFGLTGDIVSDYESIALRLTLTRATHFTLWIFLEGAGDRIQDIELTLGKFKALIQPHIPRCHQLEAFEYAPLSWTILHPEMPSFFPLDGVFPVLRRIVYRGTICDKALLNPTVIAPALTDVNSLGAWFFSRCHWTYDVPGLVNVTSLNLRHTFYHPASDLPLAACLPNLRFLKIESPSHSRLNQELSFPRLEVFSLRRGRLSWGHETLPLITAPELRHLQFECHADEPLPPCFEALPYPHLLTLQYYHRTGYDHPLSCRFDNAVQRICDDHPLIRSLAFPVDDHTCADWIRRLCDKLLAGTSEPHSTRYLPNLMTLQFSVAELGESEYQYVRWLKDVLDVRPEIRVNFVCRNAAIQPSPDFRDAIANVASRWSWNDEQDFVDSFIQQHG